MERLKKLYRELTGRLEVSVEKLPGAGSNRQYFRVGEYVGVIGTSCEENKAFCTISSILKSEQIPVPAVVAHSEDYSVYLEEDLGDLSLYDALRNGRENGGKYEEQEKELLRNTIKLLPDIQFRGGKEEIFCACYPQKSLDDVGVMFDLNYFKYCFLKLNGVEFDEYRLQADLTNFCKAICDASSDAPDTFLYRDFQARNVMLKDGRPYFIDFQGGRKGPIYYDVASFLWQASSKYPDSLRNELVDVYLESLTKYYPVERTVFVDKLHLFVFFRILQVLGAYGFRGLWEKKEYFIKSIPLALENLRQEILLGTCDGYPYLKELCAQLVRNCPSGVAPRKQMSEKVSNYLSNDKAYLQTSVKPLVVTVYSFSFKKGVPADTSGNGGGYVFDCRSTHNPGRFEEYKQLTGLDKPVIDFLEEDGEILTFLESVYKIVDFHTKRFLERGFTNLFIACGCTGGRHRSVYSAQHVAEHLHEKFGVEVHLTHREIERKADFARK